MASVNNVPANEVPTYNLVTLTNAPITTNNTQKNQDKLPKHCEDGESLKCRFSWKLIGEHYVPYIIRVINGEQLKFVSVRMAETQLLNKYLHYLHSDIYTCTSIRSHFITESEMKLLNHINQEHTDCIYGSEDFFAGKDYIVSLEDVHEFYTFLEVCYKKLLCNISTGHTEKCGFIRIKNSEVTLPYSIKDNQKYIPLFYLEGETENLRHRVIKLENWNLAYLKFCFKVMGIRDELYVGDSCLANSHDEIKNYFPPETNFEEFWPAELDTHLLINQKSTRVNPPRVWIRAPAEVVPAKNTIAHTLTAPTPLPPSMPNMINTYQNGWSANQMVNSYGTQAQPPSTRAYSIVARNKNIAAQCSNAQQQIVTISQTQQPYSGQSVHGRLTNTQQCNTLRNAGSIAIAPLLEIIDLSPPLSSLVPPAMQENPLCNNIVLELERIPEQMLAHPHLRDNAYKIQKAPLQGKMIHCINAKPYIYSNLMVTLDDLVQTVLPSCTVARCAYILNKYLKTTLFSGNSEQLSVLLENGRLKSMHPNKTPMAMLQDVRDALPQLKALVLKNDERIQQYQAATAASGSGPKRQLPS